LHGLVQQREALGVMDIRIAEQAGYLSILVEDREGIADAKEAVQQIVQALESAQDPRALIVVRRSNAIFKVEEYQLSEAILRVAGIPGSRVALVADSAELFASYEYVELLARQKHLDAKAFRSESEALQWLLR
jgi:hypothetical protein